jgi:chromosome segregation ATPase
MSINTSRVEMTQIIERFHTANRAKDQRIAEIETAQTKLEKDHEWLKERLLEKKDTYEHAYAEYWEERDKKAARQEKAELQGKFNELHEAHEKLKKFHEGERARYKGHALAAFKRLADMELDLTTCENYLKDARKEVEMLKGQIGNNAFNAQAQPSNNFGSAQVQQVVETGTDDVEMEG